MPSHRPTHGISWAGWAGRPVVRWLGFTRSPKVPALPAPDRGTGSARWLTGRGTAPAHAPKQQLHRSGCPGDAWVGWTAGGATGRSHPVWSGARSGHFDSTGRKPTDFHSKAGTCSVFWTSDRSGPVYICPCKSAFEQHFCS